MLWRGFGDKFLGYPLITDSVHHVSEVLKTLRFHFMPKVNDSMSLLQTQWQCLKLLEIYKETVNVFRRTKLYNL